MRLLTSLFLLTYLIQPAQAIEAKEQLAQWMNGNYSSKTQSKELLNYFDLNLHIVPIWTERSDGPWLYSEHASSKRPERPFRQRVLRLETTPSGVLIHLFELPTPRHFAGAWHSQTPLESLSPEQLLPKPGCNVELVYDPNTQGYKGRTGADSCTNRMYGASYSQTDLEIYPDRIIRWTKGYDDNGQQLWGAAQGGYRFEKKTH
ncbi:chromophore lyase CpcT/CpeT [Ferrimonas futtsuensis]|uniref:chromophore lyase CpcT/CpeT n=1 Tax=Ferrimonas futtsuensis TaxID=364764 RepID=UPI00040DAA16|nr:chromophore lyase CpcT/CpeT [Ferrimonas futtsuensis]